MTGLISRSLSLKSCIQCIYLVLPVLQATRTNLPASCNIGNGHTSVHRNPGIPIDDPRVFIWRNTKLLWQHRNTDPLTTLLNRLKDRREETWFILDKRWKKHGNLALTSLKLKIFAPENGRLFPKGKGSLRQLQNFQGLYVSFRDGKLGKPEMKILKSNGKEMHLLRPGLLRLPPSSQNLPTQKCFWFRKYYMECLKIRATNLVQKIDHVIYVPCHL